MNQNISSDKPVVKKEEDRFQRYEFSKRIAEKIITSNSSDSIVLGIYGAWGEGKTSIINFIETELKENTNIICIKFNPWRYNDENTLLIQFFQKLAISVDANLKTKGEKIGLLFQKYGKLLKIDIPLISVNIGDAVEGAGDILADVDIETLKMRIGAILEANKRKVVVIIDDIDRLDKAEIHSIFRLVKLTADFSNTTYILSFDQDMVASAIGDRFGDGGKQAGLDFLEKIIQVPLTIPVAQPDALKKYCLDLIDKSINESEIELSKEDVQRYISEFDENILIRLKTPRLAVRYGNTLSFSFPLLKGEVNIVDLMLIEALKIFYPKHYEFVKNHSHYFLSSYNSDSYHTGYNRIETKKKELIESLVKLGDGLSKRENESVKSLLSELFPQLDEAFKNNVHNNGFLNWYKDQRIASPKYFNRYFSYSVIKGEISDVLFNDFISSINNCSDQDVIDGLKRIIDSSSMDNFLFKLRSKEDDFEWEASKKIALCFAYSGDIFKENTSVFSFGFDSPKSQAAIFIYQLIKKHENVSERFELAKELMIKATPFDFADEINYRLRSGKTSEEKIFSTIQYQELGKELVDRALLESKDIPIFVKFADNSYYVFEIWSEIDKKYCDEYVKNVIDLKPNLVLDLLRTFTPVIRSSSHPEPYKIDFNKERYEYFIKLFDKEYIYNQVTKLFKSEMDKEEVMFLDRSNNQTDINILRQFNHWFEKESETEEIVN